MPWYKIIVVFSLCICVIACAYHFIRLIRLGAPVDFSRTHGSEKEGVIYSFTGAMNPAHKESAFLHLPTYLAGILYHIGTFISILLFFLFLAEIEIRGPFLFLCAGVLIVSSLSGIAILVKRLLKENLKKFSNPDDYISNLLVTSFQAFTVLLLLYPGLFQVYYLVASLLLLYVPIGKLKHAVYFFAARYHLGLYFGKRGVWPPKQ